MNLKIVDVRNEKSFSRISKLYKASFRKEELINVKNFHKYAYRENIFFKSFYDKNKFVGFCKGYIKNDFVYISWFASINEKYKAEILIEILKINKEKAVIFPLRSRDDIPFFEKYGFKEVKLSKGLAVTGLPIVSTKPEDFNDQEVVNGIKENDWPLMFVTPFSASIYYADVHNLDIDKEINKLPKIRKDLALKFKFDKDKKLSIGAWLLLEKVLKKHHISISDYELEISDKGKPSLKGCPYQFSISHSGNYVLVGISKAPIGVDIQEMKPIDEKILNMISNENDKEYYESETDKLNAFYKIWTLKEADSKRTGEGMNKLFKDIYINYLFLFNGAFMYEYNLENKYKIAVSSAIYKVNSLKEIKL